MISGDVDVVNQTLALPDTGRRTNRTGLRSCGCAGGRQSCRADCACSMACADRELAITVVRCPRCIPGGERGRLPDSAACKTSPHGTVTAGVAVDCGAEPADSAASQHHQYHYRDHREDSDHNRRHQLMHQCQHHRGQQTAQQHSDDT